MDKQEFIKKFEAASGDIDMMHIDKVISDCLDRCYEKYSDYDRGHMNFVSTMEESGELIQAISRRMRGRTEDNFEVLEEMADVIMSIWCISQILGISHKDIRKAINVKADREAARVEDHKRGIATT